MADSVKTEVTLQLIQEFTDGDTRTITLDDPKDNISLADINSLESFMRDTQITVGDKTGAAFLYIKKATKQQRTITNLDLIGS